MKISSINLNRQNFKGEIIDAEVIDNSTSWKAPESKPDSVSIAKLEDVKPTTPILFFAASLALASLAFIATRKTAYATIKGLENKFPLFDSLDKAGAALNKGLKSIKNKFPKTKITNVKTFFQNVPNKLATMLENFGKKGVTDADKAAFKALFKKAPIGNLYAKNAIRNVLAGTAGLGSATLVTLKRHKDEDNNGIPDRAERALTTAKEVAEVLPAVAAAVNLA